MAGSSTQSRQNVSREEFNAFQHHIDTQFGTVGSKFNSLEAAISALGAKLDEGTKPNYAILMGVGSLGLVIVGMAAALVNNQFQGVIALSNSRDTAIMERMNYVENGSNRYSKGDARQFQLDLREWQHRQDDDIEEMQKQQSAMQEWQRIAQGEIVRRGEWMEKTQETTNRLDERARYHMELDDPTDIQPKDVFEKLRDIERGEMEQ